MPKSPAQTLLSTGEKTTDKKTIVFSPIKGPQARWQEAFNIIEKKDKMSLDLFSHFQSI